jgi:hypothetical protein
MQEGVNTRCGDVREIWAPPGRNRTHVDRYPGSRSAARCSNPDSFGTQAGADQDQIAKAPGPKYQSKARTGALLTLDSFLAGLKWLNAEELIHFFAKNAEFIDASGKRWNHREILNEFETIFAPYAKKNASYVVEATLAETFGASRCVVRSREWHSSTAHWRQTAHLFGGNCATKCATGTW